MSVAIRPESFACQSLVMLMFLTFKKSLMYCFFFEIPVVQKPVSTDIVVYSHIYHYSLLVITDL